MLTFRVCILHIGTNNYKTHPQSTACKSMHPGNIFISAWPTVHVPVLMGHNTFHNMPQEDTWKKWEHRESKRHWKLALSKAPGSSFLERWGGLWFPINTTVLYGPCQCYRRQLCHWWKLFLSQKYIEKEVWGQNLNNASTSIRKTQR